MGRSGFWSEGNGGRRGVLFFPLSPGRASGQREAGFTRLDLMPSLPAHLLQSCCHPLGVCDLGFPALPFSPALRFLLIFQVGAISPARRHLVSRFGSQRLTDKLYTAGGSLSIPHILIQSNCCSLGACVSLWIREISLVSRMFSSF